MVLDSCGWLRLVVAGCGWLWMVVDGCGWWFLKYTFQIKIGSFIEIIELYILLSQFL